MLGTLAAIATAAGCAALTWAGLEKARATSTLASSLVAMGFRPGLARNAARLLPALELVTVISVLADLPSYVPATLFCMLGATFAFAALWSMLTGRRVRCACFGASERALGWPQLAALPGWLLVGWCCGHLPASTFRQRLELLALGLLLLGAARSRSVVKGWDSARSDRRAAVGG
jgi:hypothetical protein